MPRARTPGLLCKLACCVARVGTLRHVVPIIGCESCAVVSVAPGRVLCYGCGARARRQLLESATAAAPATTLVHRSCVGLDLCATELRGPNYSTKWLEVLLLTYCLVVGRNVPWWLGEVGGPASAWLGTPPDPDDSAWAQRPVAAAHEAGVLRTATRGVHLPCVEVNGTPVPWCACHDGRP